MILQPQEGGAFFMSPEFPNQVLLNDGQIRARVVELGKEISADYASQEELVIVGILKGSFVFLADLIRNIDLSVEIEMISIMSYGDDTKSSGHVRLLMDLQRDIRARDVLIVEDIVDTGRTIDYLIRSLRQRQPNSIRVCTLLDKPSRREVPAHPEYIGFEIPDQFVVGYGLDHEGKHRNLPYIAVLET